jgi:hypothetical protein
MQSNDKFKEWFNSTFEIDPDYEIAKHELEDLIARKFKETAWRKRCLAWFSGD